MKKLIFVKTGKESVSDASRKTGANNCQIGKCLRGKAITAKNFIWRYE